MQCVSLVRAEAQSEINGGYWYTQFCAKQELEGLESKPLYDETNSVERHGTTRGNGNLTCSFIAWANTAPVACGMYAIGAAYCFEIVSLMRQAFCKGAAP